MEGASIPGSLPGTSPRNGRPEGRWYTHWRGRPLPVVGTDSGTRRAVRPALAKSTRSAACGECGCLPSSKKHRRQCLGVDVPPGSEE